MKVSFSWSKPDGIPGLIARKQVDKSMFLEGSHIPLAFHEDFAAANGGDLPGVGTSHEVTLVLDGEESRAKLVNQPRHGPSSADLSLWYSRNSLMVQRLREQLAFSYRRLVVEPDGDRSPDDIPEDEREYVEFYETGTPYRYEVRLVPRRSVNALPLPPSDFTTVWADLRRVIGAGIAIKTLSRGLPNRVSWVEPEGVQVTTERGTDLVPKTAFEGTWEKLIEAGILRANQLPREALFRSTAVCTILAQLPYVDYTTYPSLTLFVTSHRFSNTQLSETFKVGTQRGIWVAGRAPDTKLVVFTTETGSYADGDHPYQDRWEGDTLYYTGEGLEDDQQMTHGNLALKNSKSRNYPVYGFRKLATGGYEYLGRFRVQEVHEEQQPDIKGTPRRVFVFEMVRTSATPTPEASPRAWVFQANPQYYNLSGALRELSELPFLVKQHAGGIRAGDRVYFWEAGENAGLVGVGTVLCEPADMPDRPESRKFYVSEEMFAGSRPRVIVRVDQVLSPRIPRGVFLNHPVLSKMTVLTVRAGTNFQLSPEQEAALIELISSHRAPQVFRISAPRSPELWAESQGSGRLYLDSILPNSDLHPLDTEDALLDAIVHGLEAANVIPTTVLRRRASEAMAVRSLRAGDRLIVTRGASTVVGLAEVESPGYTWLAEEQRHAIKVNWQWTGLLRTSRRPDWLGQVINQSDEAEYSRLQEATGPKTVPITDLAEITQQFSTALRLSGIRFGSRHDELVRAFVASLATKRLVILTGLSGSGKTQIALKFGEWLGEGRRMVVPVRPDWTGPESLFGYEDALKQPVKGRQPWYVPPVLAFMLKAARDPHYPYLLVLDEMNLAHVERYFADFLSGMESGEPCLPNLQQVEDGSWIIPPDAEAERIPVPENLFVVGTVNVDETTYMFSPKVLDRANTFEFRVDTEDLEVFLRKPMSLDPGDDDLVRGFLAIATDDEWQAGHPSPVQDQFAEHFRTLHRLLKDGDFEFGHRVFYEAIRYASMLAAAGNPSLEAALDQQVYQKVLPRLHGSSRRLEPLLRALGEFCYRLTYSQTAGSANPFDPEAPGEEPPRLPQSFQKVRRMFRSLRVNHFTSFTE